MIDIATDTNGLIKDYRFDTARVHDSQHIDDLTVDETQRVFADSAYMSHDRKQELESRGVFCGIATRRVRGQSDLAPGQKWHNRFVAGIRAVVEHPFAWMKNTGYRRARYRGLSRNGLDFALHAIAYNFKRSFSLLTSGA
jgi:IS5 family transposase